MYIHKSKLITRKFWYVIFLAVFVCFCSNCTKHKGPPTNEELANKIRDTLKSDTNLDVVTRVEGKTLYIYLPTKEKIYEVKRDPFPSPDVFLGPTLVFAGVKHEKSEFTIEYTYETFKSETRQRQYMKGFDKAPTEYASRLVRVSLYDLTQALSSSDDRFTFFVLIIADIKEGIEISYMLHERDLKKWLTLGQGFELHKSIITNANGSKSIINDTLGKHIDYKDINMADFLCDRIYLALVRDLDEELKKQHPEIPWSNKDFTEISAAILKKFNEITHSYDFLAFRNVIIKDVYTHKEKVTSFSELLDKFPR